MVLKLNSGNATARSRSRPNLWRGVVVALDGLGVAVLAVLIAAYALGPPLSTRATAPHLVWVETVRGWIVTPGVGPLEVIATLGVAVAIAGPLWYWLVPPFAASAKRMNYRSEPHRAPTGFEFDRRSADGDSARRRNHVNRRPAGSGSGSRPSRSPDWLEAVFERPQHHSTNPIDTALANGDFLRSPGGSPSRSSTSDDHASTKREPEASAGSERGLPQRTARSIHDGRSDDLASASRASVDVDALEADGGSVPASANPTPVEGITSAVLTARETLEAVEAGLGIDEGGSAEAAAETVSYLTGRADDRVRQLRDDVPGGGPRAGDALAEVHVSEQRLDAAFELLGTDG